MVERSSNRRIVMMAVERRDASILIPIIERYVKRGCIVYTDGWRGYSSLSAHDYIHFTVNHRHHFVDPFTGVHTNTIEGNWAALKRNVAPRCFNIGFVERHLLRFMIVRNGKCGLKTILDL
ncbi:hypothetical protein DMUE_0584 [Dictyocoela muelleri]|nr:hypothetical protein DMUE_0584 [Dictyocoela muelleri]